MTLGSRWKEYGNHVYDFYGNGLSSQSSVVYANKIFIIGGYSEVQVWNEQILEWEDAGAENRIMLIDSSKVGPLSDLTSPGSLPVGTSGHTSVVFNNKMWVIGGSSSTYADSGRKVHSSPDGITWTEVGNNVLPTGISDPGAVGHTSVVFNGYMWVMGAGAVNASVFQTTYSDTFFLVLPF